MLVLFKTVLFLVLLPFRAIYNWLFRRQIQKHNSEPDMHHPKVENVLFWQKHVCSEPTSPENQSKSSSSTHHVEDFDPSMMEQFFTNPGLVHIGENIFQNLDYQSLVTCQNVCQTWKIILKNPEFWIKSFIVPKIILPKNTAAAAENKNASHETSAVAAEWKYLIKKTFETSLKSNVLKAMIAQKETEKFLRSPLYMALKVKDMDLIHHCLWVFFIITKHPVSEKKCLAENNKVSKIKCLKAVLETLKNMHVKNLIINIRCQNPKFES